MKMKYKIVLCVLLLTVNFYEINVRQKFKAGKSLLKLIRQNFIDGVKQ